MGLEISGVRNYLGGLKDHASGASWYKKAYPHTQDSKPSARLSGGFFGGFQFVLPLTTSWCEWRGRHAKYATLSSLVDQTLRRNQS